MKILFIHTKYLQNRGGEDAVVEAEIELMRSRHHQVELLLFDNGLMKPGFTGKIGAGLSAVYNPTSRNILSKTIAAFQPDLIHVHNFFFTASPSVFFEARKKRIPVVVTLHNFRLICVNALLLRNNSICERCVNNSFPWDGVRFKCYHGSAMQSLMVGAMGAVHKWLGTWHKKIDVIITPSSFMRTKLMNSSLNLSQQKTFVKHNFVPDPGFATGASRDDYFLFAGRVSEEKGAEVLLQSWQHMAGHRLMIVGEGPLLNEMITRYGHLPNVQFAGLKKREEVLKLMRGCKALVFPSIWYEGLPMTLIEALATGTPVIASDIGSLSDMISDGQNGMLFPPGNANGLLQKLRLFIQQVNNGNLSFYEQARKSYLERYEPEKCYQAVMDIYQKVLNADRADKHTEQ